MPREEIIAKVQGQIWQTISTRGGIPSLPQNELAVLIDAIAAGIAAVVESSSEQMSGAAVLPAPPVESPPAGEVLLWSGKPHVSAGSESLSTQYDITSQRIRVKTGMLGRKTDEIELIRIKDVRVEQGLTERGLGVGNVILTTTDASQPMLVLRKVPKPEELKELIRRAARDEQARRGVTYREVV